MKTKPDIRALHISAVPSIRALERVIPAYDRKASKGLCIGLGGKHFVCREPDGIYAVAGEGRCAIFTSRRAAAHALHWALRYINETSRSGTANISEVSR